MLRLSPSTVALIEAKATVARKTPDQVIHDALAPTGATIPWRRPQPRPKIASMGDFITRLDEIARRSAARPIVDPRSPEEIIGYDDFGLPR
jgi:hypothetical protein